MTWPWFLVLVFVADITAALAIYRGLFGRWPWEKGGKDDD